MGGRITISNIEHEMKRIISEGWMCQDDLKELVLLGDAMKVLGHTDREFTEADAREWVSHMDPPARWTMDQTTAVMRQHGYEHRPWVFYAVMNMLVSDYGKVASRFSMDRVDFWAEMANAFIDDPDAESMKTGRYWRDIVKH